MDAIARQRKERRLTAALLAALLLLGAALRLAWPEGAEATEAACEGPCAQRVAAP